MDEVLVVNEVGPRDGLQNQKVLVACSDKLRLIRALVDAGVRSIEATSFVSPKAVPQMADADELFPLLPSDVQVAYSALVPNLRGLERARAAGVREVAVVLSATETMNQRNINMSLTQATAACAETLQGAVAAGMRTKAYIAVAFECPFEGLVESTIVLALTQQMARAGAQEVVIADTIGAANPRAVAKLMENCVRELGADRLSAHFHDTRGFALANAWAAIEQGIRKFDSSLGGLGGCPFAPGGAGNLATEDLVLMASQCGFRTGIDLERLLEAVALAEAMTQRKLGGRSSAWLEMQALRQGMTA